MWDKTVVKKQVTCKDTASASGRRLLHSRNIINQDRMFQTLMNMTFKQTGTETERKQTNAEAVTKLLYMKQYKHRGKFIILLPSSGFARILHFSYHPITYLYYNMFYRLHFLTLFS